MVTLSIAIQKKSRLFSCIFVNASKSSVASLENYLENENFWGHTVEKRKYSDAVLLKTKDYAHGYLDVADSLLSVVPK